VVQDQSNFMAHSELRQTTFRTDWDDLGCFFPFDVPLLFPRLRRYSPGKFA
jgi:hypothetical protein